MDVLISGAGIAGSTLASWLARFGHHATIVERAPARRTSGYLIDFWGLGFDVAARLGLMPAIEACGYHVREVRSVDRNGRRVGSFPTTAFTGAVGSGFTSLRRADLAAIILDSMTGVETIYGDTIVRIDQHHAGADVTFAHGPRRRFDLVVGADGLHSRVRELMFGPAERYERYLGLKVAAFDVGGYRPRDELVYVMCTDVGQQVSRFSMRDDRTMFLFIWADDDPALPDTREAQKAALRARFGRSGWECPRILDVLDDAPDLYFDRVSQIDLVDESWTRGRVTLVGDAAACISLLGGQGSSLAMAAAYVLAGELHRSNGSIELACRQYEARFRSFAAMKRRAARRFAGSFAPPSKFSLFLRNQVFKLMSWPWVADLVASRGFRDRLTLPTY